MYDLIDRPVADLPAFERTMLGATRRWVHALTLAGTVPVAKADDAFGATMRVLDEGSSDDLVIQRPCHAVVEETEAVILGLWRLVHADRLAAARGAAEGLVGPTHAARLVSAMTRATASR